MYMYAVCQNYISVVIMTSKRNLADVGIAELRHCKADTENKENTFHNVVTFHTTMTC